MSKKSRNKNPMTSPVQQQQQNPIESMSSEELALLLGEQYKMVMQCQNNITAISNVLGQRKQAMKKATEDGKQGN